MAKLFKGAQGAKYFGIVLSLAKRPIGNLIDRNVKLYKLSKARVEVVMAMEA
jgi:hypothetical protein